MNRREVLINLKPWARLSNSEIGGDYPEAEAQVLIARL